MEELTEETKKLIESQDSHDEPDFEVEVDDDGNR